MATSANLPAGQFITTLGGKRCTAIPRSAGSGSSQTSTSTTSTSTSTTTTSTAAATSTKATTTAQTTTTAAAQTTTAAAQTTTAAAAAATTAEVTSAASSPPVVANPPQAIPLQDTTTTAAADTTTTAAAAAAATSIATSIPSAIFSPASEVTAGATSPTGLLIDTTPATSTPTGQPTIPLPTTNTAGATSAAPQAASETANAAPQSQVSASPDSTDTSANSPALITTIGTASPTATVVGANAGSSGTSSSTSSNSPDSGSSSSNKTVVVAGGVIGGFALIFVVGFLIWFFRSRSLKRRRSTLLTPLSIDPSNTSGSAEKGAYEINRTSLGPTPLFEKLKTSVSANVQGIRDRMGGMTSRQSPSTPGVNLNRGNSQYGDAIPARNRSNSNPDARIEKRNTLSVKDRFLDWFSRLTEDASFNWRLRNESRGEFRGDLRRKGSQSGNALLANTKGNPGSIGSQPDFLTLLNMDDAQLDREAAKGRSSMARNPNRRSGSAGSNHFLGKLNLNFDGEDPFADSNAMRHDSARVEPLIVSAPGNPFSDANAINPAAAPSQPQTYVHNIRRSRGQSVGGATPTTAAGGVRTRPGSRSSRGMNTMAESIYRESGGSVESFATRRNKFRSDPFDLELLSSSQTSQVPLPETPMRVHQRMDSSSSRYTSGVPSLDEWSDPGPDVGPAATRWDSPTPTDDRRDTIDRRPSAASQRTVGKAL